MASYLKREESNCLKLFRLLTEMGKHLLVKFLQESLTTAGFPTLDAFLSSQQTHLNNLPLHVLRQEQWDILFPPSKSDTDITKWDITLAACVVNTCVSSLQQQHKDAIQKIRTLRNTLFGHIGEIKMNDYDFNRNWTDMQQKLAQAANDLLTDHVGYNNLLQTRSHDIKNDDVVDYHVVTALESWYNSDKEIKSLMNKFKRSQEEHIQISKDTLVEVQALGKGHDTLRKGQEEQVKTNKATLQTLKKGHDTLRKDQEEHINTSKDTLVEVQTLKKGHDTLRKDQEEHINTSKETLIEVQTLKKGHDTLRKGQEEHINTSKETLVEVQTLKKGHDTLRKDQEEHINTSKDTLVEVQTLKKGHDTLRKDQEEHIKTSKDIVFDVQTLKKGHDTLRKDQEEHMKTSKKTLVEVQTLKKGHDTLRKDQEEHINTSKETLVEVQTLKKGHDTLRKDQEKHINTSKETLVEVQTLKKGHDTLRKDQEEHINTSKETLVEVQTLKKEHDTLRKGQEEHINTSKETLVEVQTLKKGHDTLRKGQEEHINTSKETLVEVQTLKKGHDTLRKDQEKQINTSKDTLVEVQSLKKGHDTLRKDQEEHINTSKDTLVEVQTLRKEHDTLKNDQEEHINTSKETLVEVQTLKKEHDTLRKDQEEHINTSKDTLVEVQTLKKGHDTLRKDQEEHINTSKDTLVEIQTLKKGHDTLRKDQEEHIKTSKDTLVEVQSLKKGQDTLIKQHQEQYTETTEALSTLKKGQDILIKGQGELAVLYKEKSLEDKGNTSHSQRPSTSSTPTEKSDTGLSPELLNLQTTLIELYEKWYIKTPATVQGSYYEADIGDIYVTPEMYLDGQDDEDRETPFSNPNYFSEHTIRTDQRIPDNKWKKKRITIPDLFSEDDNRFREIYVAGEAGVGKTSLCKDIVAAWCSAHHRQKDTSADNDPSSKGLPAYRYFSSDQEEDKKEVEDKLTAMLHFDFLFYISLRYYKDCDVENMICSQILRNVENKEKFLRQILSSDRSLIVLDGLDEWTPSTKHTNPTVSTGIPDRDQKWKCTILTTSRPWVLEKNRLSEKEVDRQVGLTGVRDKHTLARKLVHYLNYISNKKKPYSYFFEVIDTDQNLERLTDIPILLKQLICLWHQGKSFGKSKTDVYTNLLEMMIQQAEKHREVKLSDVNGGETEIMTPTFFRKGRKCDEYKSLLASLGHLAFDTIGLSDSNEQLVFESQEEGIHGICAGDISIILKIGLLSQNIMPNIYHDHKKVSFLHKTFQEYFAAMWLSLNPSMIKKLGIMCRYDIFRFENILIFMCGMCPSEMKALSQAIGTHINNVIKAYRSDLCSRSQYRILPLIGLSNKHIDFIGRLQSLACNCYNESANIGVAFSPIPICDAVIDEDLPNESIIDCLAKDPTQLISLVIFQETMTYELIQKVDLKPFSRLEFLHIGKREGKYSTSTGKLIPQVPFEIDASQCTQLKRLFLIDIPAKTVKVKSRCLEHVMLEEICQIPHDDISALISNISESHTLISLRLKNIKCESHEDGGECSINVDTTSSTGMDYLHLEGMTLTTLKWCTQPSSPIDEITLENISLPYDGIRSLTTSISESHNLRTLHLKDVNCKDHKDGGECSINVDTSSCTDLYDLRLEDMSLATVKCSKKTSVLTLTSISLPHYGIRSLMTSISESQNLKTLYLKDVKCKDHTDGGECSIDVDTSSSTYLYNMHLEEMSLATLKWCTETMGITLKSISISEINSRSMMMLNGENRSKLSLTSISLPHYGIRSLMTSISESHNLRTLHLKDIKCKDHKDGGECSINVDTSSCTGLYILHLEEMSLATLKLCTKTSDITLKSISLHHNGILSLTTSISESQNLKLLQLKDVKCKEHKDGGECSINVDTSPVRFLSDLHIEDISLAAVKLCTKTSVTTLKSISLHHNDILSLTTSISECQNLSNLHLKDVKCKDHTDGGECSIDVDTSTNRYPYILHFEEMSLATLKWCTQTADITLKSISLSHYGIRSMMTSISESHNLRKLHLKDVKCKDHTDGGECSINVDTSLSRYMSDLHLEDMSLATVKLCTNTTDLTLTSISIHHNDIRSLMTSISENHGLRYLHLKYVKCKDHTDGGECSIDVDTSTNRYLSILHFEEMSLATLKWRTAITGITLKSISLSHCGIRSLMTNISECHTLCELHLKDVKCKDHTDGGECSIDVDTSSSTYVDNLHLEDMSLATLKLCTGTTSITLKSISLHHNDIRSLMTSISESHGLWQLHLKDVKCKDHTDGGVCSINVDTSSSTDLYAMHLEDMSLATVKCSKETSFLTLKSISLPHYGKRSLMTSISESHNLQKLHLKDVKCKDHTDGVECSIDVDTSSSTYLNDLHFEEMSLATLKWCTETTSITLKSISLSHNDILSLMTSISESQNLEELHLKDVKCKDHTDGGECSINVDTSTSTDLDNLHLEEMSLATLKWCTETSYITLKSISLSHYGKRSLMTSISESHNLRKLHLKDVKCKDHTDGVECSINVDTSTNTDLDNLHIEDMSLATVKLCTNTTAITLKSISLPHDAIRSLMKRISKSHDLWKLHLKDVKCKDHTDGGECSINVDTSSSTDLNNLHLEGMSLATVKCSVRFLTFKITLKNLSLPHKELLKMMTIISECKDIRYVHIETVKCKDHPDGEGCGYEIELAELNQLKHLFLADITPSAVRACPHMKSITLKEIHVLPHTSLSALLTRPLKGGSATVQGVSCKDHGPNLECLNIAGDVISSNNYSKLDSSSDSSSESDESE